MSRVSWKILGLAALIAVGVPVGTMSGASALTLPIPAKSDVESTHAFDDQVVEIASKKYRDSGNRNYSKKSYKNQQRKSYNKSYKKQHKNVYKKNSKKYQKNVNHKNYKKHRNDVYKKNKHYTKKHAWYYNKHRHGHRYSHRRHGYNYHYGNYWYARPWWTLQVVPSAPAYGYGNDAHVQYCLNKYRSYNPQTDMYLGYDGRYHYCVSPY